MQLSDLAAKQQRLKTWLRYLDTEVQSEELHQRMKDTLQSYRTALARCWKTEKITDQDRDEIQDLERQLEELDEEARMVVVARAPSDSIPNRF